MRLIVCVCRVVRHGRREVQHIVVVTFLEDLVKDAFSRVVSDLDKVDLRCVPFGMDGDEVGAGFLGAHRARHCVAGFEALVDHSSTDEAVSTRDEYMRHDW